MGRQANYLLLSSADCQEKTKCFPKIFSNQTEKLSPREKYEISWNGIYSSHIKLKTCLFKITLHWQCQSDITSGEQSLVSDRTKVKKFLHLCESCSKWIETLRAICWQSCQCAWRAQTKVKAFLDLKSVLSGWEAGVGANCGMSGPTLSIEQRVIQKCVCVMNYRRLQSFIVLFW